MKKILSLSVISVIAGGAACAATITQVQNFDLTGGDLNLSYNGFDTKLGALTGAYIELSYVRTGGYLGVDNESATSATVTFTHLSRFYVDSDGVVLDWSRISGGTRLLAESLNRTTSSSGNMTVGADSDGAPDYAGSDYLRYELADVVKNSDGYFANVSQFNDKPSFEIPVTVSQSNSITGLGGSAQNYLPAGLSGTMTLTYTYTAATPVPEPSGACLSVMAFSWLVLKRHRKLRNSQ